MAVNTFIGTTDSNWGTAGNWSLGTVPTSTDTHTTTFDAASPACTLNGNRVCYNLDMTNYVGTLTFGIYTLDVYNNSIILGSGATLSMTGGYLRSYANNLAVSITSNGCYVPYLYLSGVNPHTITLLDNFNVGTFHHRLTTNVLLTVNGFKILVDTDYTTTTGAITMAGTTVIEFTGSGSTTWGGTTSTALVGNPIIVNKSGGTLTLRPYVCLGSGCVLTYSAGTVDATTNNSILYIDKIVTLNTAGITWNIIQIVGFTTSMNLSISSLLTADKIQMLYYPVNFIGSYGWTCNDFIISATIYGFTTPISLKSTLTYTINTLFEVYGSNINHAEINASTPGSKAILTYNGIDANQKIINCDFTDIDASGGNKLWTLHGVISNSDNVEVSSSSIVPLTISSVF